MTQPGPAPSWASASGDDRFGPWAEFGVRGVVQRMRWVGPGEFTMGSSAPERRRIGDAGDERQCENESPPRRVRLTQGCWLAQTACTQALWLAVVAGANPSRFQGDERLPVERVSWDDVMERFMPRLEEQLGAGVRAGLPTQARWEHACRAGTRTAFSFGERVTSEQVNFDGDAPYGDAPKSEYRQRTVPVGSLPANAWGLHEMHGNVWEWCADGHSDDETLPPGEVVEDPVIPAQAGRHALRAVRGGSWIDDAWSVRSACRFAFARAARLEYVGFRLMLSSAGPA